jgi:beta-lactamase regulating signal transducer with metallopeptidase domain
MTASHLQTLAQFFAERLLNTAVEGIILAGLVWLVIRLMGRTNSGTRFAVWFTALLAIVALPLLGGTGFGAVPKLPFEHGHRELTLSSSWAFYLLAAWSFVAAFLLLRLAFGLWRVRGVRTNSLVVDLADLDPAISNILRHAGSRRRVTLCVSKEVAVPAAIGFFRPAIIFPVWLLPELSLEEIKVVLLHELAHLQRWDDWTNLGQKVAKAVFFFHPAVWWIENRLTLEREMACDDMVLAETANPRAYASSLISFAEKLQNPRCLALAQALVSRMRHLSLRVTQILSAKRTAGKTSPKPVFAAGAAMIALVAGAAPYAPQLVAFQDQTQSVQTQVDQTRQVSSSQIATNSSSQVSRVAATRADEGPTFAGQARAISAAFTTRTTGLPAPLKLKARRKPAQRTTSAALVAKSVRKGVALQETFLILQTTRFDASGEGVWTLCIWKITGGNAAEPRLESAILMSSI